MALRFIDSFDHYVTAQMTRKWNTVGPGVTIAIANGRNGTNACQITNQLTKTLDSQGTWIIGGAINIGRFVGRLFSVADVGTSQIEVYSRADGTLSVTKNNGSTTLATSTLSLSLGVFYYLEFKAVVATSGSYEVRVNGVTWISGSGNTRVTANESANVIVFGTTSGGAGWVLDDVYICDGTGGIRNTFLGDVMVTPLYPSGDGDLTQWTPIPSIEDNWQNVNELLVSDDAQFNYATSAGQVDLYAIQNPPYSPSAILGLQWNGQIRKTDASSYVLNSAVKFSTVHYGAAGYSPNVSYFNYTDVYAQNPDTSTDFTISDINSMQAGVKLVSII